MSEEEEIKNMYKELSDFDFYCLYLLGRRAVLLMKYDR